MNTSIGINVVSVFNGMGCIWYALDRAGIKVNKRYSSEIDKYANQANNVAFPNTIQLGSIVILTYGYCWRNDIFNKAIASEYISDTTKRKLKKFRALRKVAIDLYVGGSPCQGFSFAGKQLNFNDPRSKLFFNFVRLLNKIREFNPEVKFLLENVNMKKEYMRVINEHIGIEGVRINSNRQSAQNRDRWYWSNIKTRNNGLFGDLVTDIPQPKDEGILLKDILQPEHEVDEKYYLKNPKVGFKDMDIFSKSNTLRTGGQCSQSNKHNYDLIKIDKKGNIKADQEKAGCLTAGGNSGGNHSDMDLILQRARGYNKGGVHRDKAPTLTSNSWEQNNTLIRSYSIRRLTVRECGRLQTFTDEELDVLLNSGISSSQLYKMFGNGWTIDVIAHILSFLNYTV